MSGDYKASKDRKFKKFINIVSYTMIFIVVSGAAFYGFETFVLNENFLADENKTDGENIESFIYQMNSILSEKEPSENSDNGESTVSVNQTEEGIAEDISVVVENVMPAIVSIKCDAAKTVTDIFGRKYSKNSVGSGSGIIIGNNEKEVLIVTNNHVIDGATAVKVTLSEGTECTATIKGTDAASDLSVIAVNIAGLSEKTLNSIRIAALGNSKQLKVGEMAVAIGNALGYGQSVTVGNISALNREMAAIDYSMKLIQTDAAINPGNSGGALINVKGEVIGINSIKYASEEVEGIGYAIPISDAIPIIKELMNSENISDADQVYLGVTVKDVTLEHNIRYGLPMGVYVLESEKNSPANEAGIQKGDIIISIDSNTILDGDDLREVLSDYRKYDNASVTVMRIVNGKYKEKKLTVQFTNQSDSLE